MPVAFVKGKLGPNFWDRSDLPMGWVTVGIMRDGQGWVMTRGVNCNWNRIKRAHREHRELVAEYPLWRVPLD